MRPPLAGIALLAIVAAVAHAETTAEVLFRARQAQLVLGDIDLAVRLYRQALDDETLPVGTKAETHLRLALCYEELKDWARADLHLAPALFEGEGVPAEVRRLADELEQHPGNLLRGKGKEQ